MARPALVRPVLLTVAAVVLAGSAVAAAAPAHHQAPARHRAAGHHSPRPPQRGSYLALGDSVAFGYRESANLPTPDYTRATNFTGYPEYVAQARGLTDVNLSCPGETSASFVTAGAQSNGCENSTTGPVGYRTLYPLHTAYRGTQLAAAVAYLRSHRSTRLVSLMIGANDGFVCQETTKDDCASELPGVLKTVSANVATILSAVRHTGYRGPLVLVNYYSLDYRSSTQTASTEGLNQALDSSARTYRATIADGYGTFRAAAAQAGGDTCAAGLLTTLTTGGCGVHPSIGGQSLLAVAVEHALAR